MCSPCSATTTPWALPTRLQYFSRFPELRNLHWYAVRTRNCYFIMLDSNVSNPDNEQWKWLLERLGNVPEGVQYLFIVQHHPAMTHSSGRLPRSEERRVGKECRSRSWTEQ